MHRRWLYLIILIVGLGLTSLSSRPVHATYGPVYDPPYNGGHAKDFSLVRNGTQWVIVAINDPVPWPPLNQPENAGLPVSTSYDLEHWTYQGVAIPVGTTGSWDDRAAWAPSIIKSGNTWYLYYAGVHVQGNTLVQKIGLATSTDLIHWTKEPTNPIFDCSTLPWAYWDLSDAGNGASCRDPFVIRDDAHNQWVMFFTASLPHDPNPPYWGLASLPVVGMATSTDLIHWTDAGHIDPTRGPTAESPHAFVHNGTWWLVFTSSCNFNGETKCLQYTTAPSLTGPYTGRADVPDVESYHFASEYYLDPLTGQEMFNRVGIGQVVFSYMDWSTGSLTLHYPPQARFTGWVWNDLNRNGIQDPDEPGLTGVKLHFYYDDGDGQFNPALDHPILTGTTRTISPTGTPQLGYYNFTSFQQGLNWVTIGDENFAPGGVLNGLTLTTPAAVSANVTADGTVSGLSFGLALPDTTPPAAVQDLQ